jgi:4-amino-4-deoxy-L-arabinose transferase-like glycosyltransferase
VATRPEAGQQQAATMVTEVWLGDAMRVWARTLPERHGGRGVLWALVAILVVAFVARLIAALVGWDFRNGSDADMYERLAAQLYHAGEWGIPGSANPYDFAPGAPLFAAAIYNLIGDASPVAARIGLAVAGTGGVLVVYLLGRRLAGPRAGLVAAGLAAVYPPTLFYTSLLSGEPLAVLTVPGAVLAFLWAADRGRSPWAWALPGLLLGLTVFLRPEYLALTALLALLAVVAVGRRAGPWRGLAAGGLMALAFAVTIAPWATIATNDRGRFVPISTGGGKALFIGTYLPGDGLHDRTKQQLYHRFHGTDPTPEQLRLTPMNPLLDEVAEKYPQLPRDEALGRIGRENLIRWSKEEPRAVAEMIAGKIAHMWHGSGSPSYTPAGGVVHYLVLVAGFAGLVLLLVRRRWEVLPILVLLVGISLIGGLLLAGTRRNLPVMPLVMALAGVSLTATVDSARERAARRRVVEPEAVESLLAPH